MSFIGSTEPSFVAAYQAAVAARNRIYKERHRIAVALERNKAERVALQAESQQVEREAAAIGIIRERREKLKNKATRDELLALWNESPERQGGGTQRCFAKRLAEENPRKWGSGWQSIERQLSVVKKGRRRKSKSAKEGGLLSEF